MVCTWMQKAKFNIIVASSINVKGNLNMFQYCATLLHYSVCPLILCQPSSSIESQHNIFAIKRYIKCLLVKDNRLMHCFNKMSASFKPRPWAVMCCILFSYPSVHMYVNPLFDLGYKCFVLASYQLTVLSVIQTLDIYMLMRRFLLMILFYKCI